MWAFEDALPVDQPDGIGSAIGGTPLVRAAPLDAAAGCRVYLKHEGGNPTGTFKDRGSVIGVELARRREQPVITVSHGNMARSVASLAAAAGVEAGILVPADVPSDRLPSIQQYDPVLYRVDGDYAKLYYDTLDLSSVLPLNSDVPLRVAGQKTLAYEIAAQAPNADAVVMPVSSGGNASAVWKGFRELVAGGQLDTVPSLYLVQAAACAPIAHTASTEASTVDPVDREETIAYSIGNPDPPSGTRALQAARATDGDVLAVDDPQIRRAQRRLAERVGLSAEPAAATVLAGMATLAADGTFDPEDDVVGVITGRGQGESTSTQASVPMIERTAVAATITDALE